MKSYRAWEPLQSFLLPPSPREWLPEGHLVWFVLDVVSALDLSGIERAVQSRDPRGTVPYHPHLLVALLVYGYTVGLVSSRKLERATYEDVAFRALCGGNHPDHTVISRFRKSHLEALEGLFLQVLQLCQAAGLVKLGSVALDGTKMKANASLHKAMSYERMLKTEEELRAEVQSLLSQAEQVDATEDALYGPDRRGDELPAELARRESRLRKLREARAALEAEAAKTRAMQVRGQAEQAREKAQAASEEERGKLERRAEAREAAAEARAERARELAEARVEQAREQTERQEEAAQTPQDRRTATAAKGRQSQAERDQAKLLEALSTTDDTTDPGRLPEHRVQAKAKGTPQDKAQRNFTDPDSRVMKQGTAYVQAYNAQAIVDAEHQVIVAQCVTNQPPDVEHLAPLLVQLEANCGRPPEVLSADSGYWSEPNVKACEDRGIDPYIATKRDKHRNASPEESGAPAPARQTDSSEAKIQMQEKLHTEVGKAIYGRRKVIVEPVFGQIKDARGLRNFLLRGVEQARSEWALICTGHNLLKLFRARCAAAAHTG